MGELGLTAVPFPSEIGGAGFSYRAWTLVMEEIAYADMALAVSLSVHILSQYPVITWGTDEQKARWLPDMLTGKKMGAFGLTEPQAGSDASALKLRAVRTGTASAPISYMLTGTKIWITNSAEAECFLVFASTIRRWRHVASAPSSSRATHPVSRLARASASSAFAPIRPVS
jgi:alkylation response protein AidB-like acyl-CoA dehydrogenase